MEGCRLSQKGSRFLVLALAIAGVLAAGCGSSEEQADALGGGDGAGGAPPVVDLPPTVFPLPGDEGSSGVVLGLLENHFLGGVNNTVRAVGRTANGKHIVVGAFSKRIIRYNADGSLDTAFNAAIGSGANNEILSLLVLPDESIIIGGRFTAFNGVATPRLARINADGSVNVAFTTNLGAGPSGGTVEVQSLALAGDGGFYLAGPFKKWNGEPAAYDGGIHKFSTEGQRLGFQLPGALAPANSSQSYVLHVQASGALVVGCRQSTTVGGQPVNGLFRVMADGSLDTSAGFAPTTGRRLIESGSFVRSLYSDAGGRLYVGGSFTQFVDGAGNNYSAPRLMRLDGQTGAPDLDFLVGLGVGFNGDVYAITEQQNGDLFIGGGFTMVQGAVAGGLARLKVDGTLESSFTSVLQPNGASLGFNNIVRVLNYDSQGRLVVAGQFTKLNSITVGRLLRLY
jgi:hypothetical protein